MTDPANKRPANPETEHRTRAGVIRHNVFGVVALAVAALDFVIGTRIMFVAGVLALTASAYSFIRAHRLRTR
ncbi:hypothetical protein G9U53_30280 [Rhodococcus sp. D-46]|uniref:hypothetical protein n=1 Tax=Rhodococcus sp. D-46 TaxID=2716265 RepID=UPI0013F5D361|nr:hypothetical protein [Rhodococcus sp. D-46]